MKTSSFLARAAASLWAVVVVVAWLMITSVQCDDDQQNVVRLTVCPKKFKPIGRKCYHFGKEEVMWQDAHFKCVNLNSTLAVVTRSHQELLMRQYLIKHANVLGKYERWIGGTFNWKQGKWIWGASGRPLVFHGFSRMNPNLKDKWKWHCIIIDPARQNKWSARNCMHQKRYVCQTDTNKIVTSGVCNDPNLTPYESKRCLKREHQQHQDPNVPGHLVQRRKKPQIFKEKDFICPPHMIIVGRKCYYFSLESVSWSDAYWACLDNKTRLAVITTKMQDNILRGFLNGNFVAKRERWIGGMYDSRQHMWKWAMKGNPVKYQNFAAASANTNHTYNCITMDPLYEHEWNSKPRFQEKQYICQVKPKTVGKYRKRKKLRAPDATVVINFDNSHNNINYKSLEPTTETYPFNVHNTSLREEYVRN